MNKRISFILSFTLILALVSSFCWAQDKKLTPKELFVRGNNFYEEGEYAKAIDEYKKILDSGIESAAIYFNIADAYFKEGDLGQAILNFEHALTIDPRDPDIRANYKYARSLVKGQILQEKGIWAWRPLAVLSGSVNLNEITLIFTGLVMLFFILVFVFIIMFSLTVNRQIVILTVFFLIIFSALITFHKVQWIKKRAVVVVPSVDALFGPFDSATKFFHLNEGMGVFIIKSKDDWYKVRRSDGKVGWIPKIAVQRLINGTKN